MKRILLVDDERAFTRITAMLLRKRGYDVREENSAVLAVQTAREFLPDVIFMDVIMPNMDGGTVAGHMHEVPELKDVPIIFMTAIVSTPRQESSGEILSKPASVEQLVECIERHTTQQTNPQT